MPNPGTVASGNQTESLNVLRTNVGIEDESLPSSPFFIFALAAIGRAKGRILQSAKCFI
jgi:hypothetical protein